MSPCPAKQRAANGEPPRPVDPDRPSDEVLAGILTGARTIAVVGMSDTEGKAAYSVPRILIEHGWDVVPVNPHHTTVAGLPSYASLAEVPRPIDLVNVFRPAEETPAIAHEAAAIGAGGIWLQAGIRSDEAREIADAAAIAFVQNACCGAFARRNALRPAR
ncbi:MAG: CoA-binding protein [Thermoleophilia bacterium]|nr:CoA-binding protein [Thermoleophilia bacterium]